MLQELEYDLYKAVGNKGRTTPIEVETMEEYVEAIAKDGVWVQGTLDTMVGPPLDTPLSSDPNSEHHTPPYTTIHHHTPPYTTTPPQTTTHHCRTPPHTTVHHHHHLTPKQ
jgi:hypothetical protein